MIFKPRKSKTIWMAYKDGKKGFNTKDIGCITASDIAQLAPRKIFF